MWVAFCVKQTRLKEVILLLEKTKIHKVTASFECATSKSDATTENMDATYTRLVKTSFKDYQGWFACGSNWSKVLGCSELVMFGCTRLYYTIL